ncbi:7050_t:CDS:10 [Entrophospora sp. SA101]|nr:7050_t:CDS:10 [Entrophospora sp. SA101]
MKPYTVSNTQSTKMPHSDETPLEEMSYEQYFPDLKINTPLIAINKRKLESEKGKEKESTAVTLDSTIIQKVSDSTDIIESKNAQLTQPTHSTTTTNVNTVVTLTTLKHYDTGANNDNVEDEGEINKDLENLPSEATSSLLSNSKSNVFKHSFSVLNNQKPVKPLPKPLFRHIPYPKVDEERNIFVKPEGHYIRHNELTEKDLLEIVEYDMDEQDDEWLSKLNEERKKENCGELSTEIFEALIDRIEKEWFDLTKNLPKNNDKDNLTAEDSICAICDDGECENSNAIVFCDGCNLAVHQECYGIPYIPEGQWLCRKCIISPENPVVCGAFKKTTTNRWAHLLCAIWIPEVWLSNHVYMEPIDNLQAIPRSRWRLKCYICEKKVGACIQCQNTHCCTAFHVTCARKAKLCMKTKFPEANFDKSNIKINNSKSNGINKVDNIDENEETSSTSKLKLTRKRKGKEVATEQFNQEPASSSSLLDVQNSKAARAYNHSYSETAPVLPVTMVEKLLPILSKQKFLKKKHDLLDKVCKYWSTKRESRRGAPLLKRLHLEPWTASASIYKQSEEEKYAKYLAMTDLRKDLEKVRMLSDLVHRREKEKLKRLKIQTNYLETIFFPLDNILLPTLKSIQKLDKHQIFAYPVSEEEVPDYHTHISHPMDFSTIQKKIEEHEYSLGSGFQGFRGFRDDIELTFKNAMTYNTPDSIYYRVAKKLNQQTKPILDKAEQDYLDLGIDPDKMIMELDLDPEIFTYNNEPLAVDEEAMEEATVKEEIVEETPEGIIKDTTSGAIRRIKRKFSFLSTRVTRSRTVVEQHHHDDDQDNNTVSKSNLQIGDKPRKIRKLPKGWVMLPDDDEEEVEKVEKEEELDETLMDVDQKQEELVDDDVVSSRTRSRKTTRIEELDTVEPLKNETDIIHGKRTIRDMIVDTSPTVASTPTYSRRTNRDPIIDTSPTISPTSTYSRRTNRDIMTDTSPTPIYGRRTNRDIIADISPAPIYGRRTNHNVTDTSPTVSPTARYGRRTNRYVTDMSPIVSPTARYGRRTNLDTSPTVSPATRFGRRTNLDMSPTVSPATRYSKRINRDVIDTSPIVSPAATISTIVSSTTASPLSRKKLNTAVLESTDISYGSLVWAKMQGFPWYPAEIVHPGSLQVPEAVRHDKKDGDMFLVRFFDEKPGKKNGSRSWKWVAANKVVLMGDRLTDFPKLTDKSMT